MHFIKLGCCLEKGFYLKGQALEYKNIYNKNY
jgi:hypothetical protein